MYLEDHKKFYDMIYSQGLSTRQESSGYRSIVPANDIFDFIDWVKDRAPNGTVLDLGCGAGRYTIPYAEAGYKCTGVDFSAEAIRLARQIAKDKGLEIDYVQGNILDYEFNKYDIINDDGCLHHIAKEDWPKYQAALQKASKPGTYIRLKAFSRNCSFFENGEKLGSGWIRNGTHCTYCFTEEELKELFKDYKITSIEDKAHPLDVKKRFWQLILENNK